MVKLKDYVLEFNRMCSVMGSVMGHTDTSDTDFQSDNFSLPILVIVCTASNTTEQVGLWHYA